MFQSTTCDADILKGDVLEEGALPTTSARPIGEERVVSHFNGHKVAGMRLLVRVWPDVADAKAPPSVVDHRAGIRLMALVLDGPWARASIVADLTVLDKEVVHAAKCGRADADVT